MKYLSALVAVSCGVAAGTATVHAADIQEPVIYEDVAAPNYSGWYLRGDIGYSFKSKSGGDWSFWNIYEPPYRGIDDHFKYDKFSLKGAATFGGGVGYRYNERFRSDATLDFFRAGIEGNTACPSYLKSSYGLNPVEPNCTLNDRSTADIWTAMANTYVDLASIGPVTPYLGAGIGAAHVSYDTWKTSILCSVCTYQSDKEGLDSWRFAMSAMAGVSYDLTDSLKLDLGYRFLRINGGKAYGYDALDRAGDNDYGSGPGATGTQARDSGFNIHTIRTGLRYEF